MNYDQLLKLQDNLYSKLDLLDFMTDGRQPNSSQELASSPDETIENHCQTMKEFYSSDFSLSKDNDGQALQASQGRNILHQPVVVNAQTEEQQYIRENQQNSNFKMAILPQTKDTKNLIQFFRSPIQRFLKQQLPEQVLEKEQAYRSFAKSVSQYKLIQLFLVPRFRSCFRKYFDTNQIYRDLLTAGIQLESKKKFAKKLRFFEDTFNKVTINTIQVHQM